MSKPDDKTNPKSKKQIEADHPFIKPENCPGAVIDWVVKRDEKREEELIERDKALVKLIENTIDKLFEKHFKKYVTMIFNNRLIIVLLILSVVVLYGIVFWHITGE